MAALAAAFSTEEARRALIESRGANDAWSVLEHQLLGGQSNMLAGA